MNQTRTFLIILWLMAATWLWLQWTRESAADLATANGAQTAQVTEAIPGTGSTTTPAVPVAPNEAAVPTAPAVPGLDAASAPVIEAAPSAHTATVTTDVLRLSFSQGNVVDAALLAYPETRDEGSPPVRLFNSDPARFYAAQSGWVNPSQNAPTHLSDWVLDGEQTDLILAAGAQTIEVPFVWEGDGVRIRRVFTIERGNYAVRVEDTISNTGAAPWQGHVYRQLTRVPPRHSSSMTNPQALSFDGGTWYSAEDGYQRSRFAKFVDDGPLNQRATEGWIAILQHHFFSAWIPQPQDEVVVSLHVDGANHLIRGLGPGVVVQPGQQETTSARLWVGPKTVDLINAQGVRGLDRAVDYSRFSIMAALGGGLFWILDKMHGIFNNWGWAIIGLVVVIRLLMFPLSAAQYKSFARMRKFQPRIQQLKERYGDDRQKFQTAMMELYKKEKINPIGGCLPLLVQMPIFFALYWVLLESVELRHAPWFGWIQDLTARDPWFILPVLNILVMWTTQKLTPMVGVDPMQQKIMQLMPVVFGAIMIFFPSGLVLYWVTSGAFGLAQQWWFIRKYADKPATARS